MRFFSLFVFSLLAFVPVFVFAQETPSNNLVNLPIGDSANFNDYINAVYIMFISIAALIAVVKIIIAGVKYMFTDIVTQKGEARKDITSALLGLLVVMSAVLVLFVINPDLVTFDPQITQLEGGVPPRDADGLTTGDVATVEKFCADNAGQCSTQSCEYIAEDYLITKLVNDPLNRIACSTFCKGVVVGRDILNKGQCLYISDTVPFELPELNKTITVGCPDGDCDQARQVCENGYGADAKEVTVDGLEQIECSPAPDKEIFGCISLGRGSFDCDAAKSKCDGGRTVSQITPDQIVCEK